VNDERRVYDRVTLFEPIDAWFGDFAVRVVDISTVGAQIESDEALPPDARGLLRFFWRNQEVEILAETSREMRHAHIGLLFVEESDALQTLVSASSREVLRALEANARGDRAGNVIGDETLTAAWHRPIAGYVCWIYEDGRWDPRHSPVPDQPENGFTISAAEPEEQVALLRETYESGSEESRALTRKLAELSVLGVDA
jgi:hypothetical protein